MQIIARIGVATIGLVLVIPGLQWIIVPETAASSLYLTLPEDAMARSTLVGDFSAFFITGAAMCWVGALRRHAIWIYASAILLGTAAIFRLNALLFHDAGLPYELLSFEVIGAVFLFWAAPRVHLDRHHRHIETHSYSSEV